MEAIKEFLSISSGDGSGYGYGSGSGYGSGYGSGSGSGSGSGYGYGSGSGSGSGSGYGSGYGDGSGYGSGYGDGIAEYNGAAVYMVDGVPTLIASVRGNLARGQILNSNFTTTPCYVCKIENQFAHGSSLREARDAALEKIFDDKPENERIEAFVSAHAPGVEYPNTDFFSWHHRLTGSCKMGREQFAKDHGIDVEHGSMTPEEFIRLTQNAYGGGIIRKLKEHYPAANAPN